MSIDSKDYIVFRFAIKDYNLIVGSKISFLFEGGEILEFYITLKPYKHSKNAWGQVYETRLQLTTNELEILTNLNLLKWQIELPDSEKKIRDELESFEQFIVKNLTQEYREFVKEEISDYVPLEERVVVESNEKNGEACYVYLIIDTTNNYHKIGISNHPDYKEKTLQSEKPTIEMVSNKRFPNRKIAASFEQALHQAYSEKRVRGEWFDLDKDDVNDIKESQK